MANLSSIITPTNLVTLTGTATLTNKTINIASNTLTGVQSTLVSGTSIKTVNSTSLLGSGDIAISAGFTLGTPVATTSGTSITFTGIPAGVKQVIVTFKGVSTNGTAKKIVRIGPVAGVETSAYNGMQLHAYGGSLTRVFSSAGFLFGSDVASETIHGSMTLTLQNSSTNSWAAHGGQSEAGQQTPYFNAGIKSLAGALSVLSITTDNETDTFDAGQVNIAYL